MSSPGNPAHAVGFPRAWAGLVDDAAVFPPGDAALVDARAEHLRRREEPAGGLVRSFVVRDTDLPELDGFDAPISIVLTGGASQLDGALRKAGSLGLAVVGLETALRDLDDLPGNARRVTLAVDAARDQGLLDEACEVYVELPVAPVDASWLAAADEVAAMELRLKFRTGGLDAAAFPTVGTLAGWVDAALDRETPFKCTAGLHRAVRHTSAEGFEEHGFLNLALATLSLFDGESGAVGLLDERDPAVLTTLAAEQDLTRARRWFTSFGSCSVEEPLNDLVSLGLLDPVTAP